MSLGLLNCNRTSSPPLWFFRVSKWSNRVKIVQSQKYSKNCWFWKIRNHWAYTIGYLIINYLLDFAQSFKLFWLGNDPYWYWLNLVESRWIEQARGLMWFCQIVHIFSYVRVLCQFYDALATRFSHTLVVSQNLGCF